MRTTNPAVQPSTHARDVIARDVIARDVLARLETAWNDADGEAFGAVYAPDASFVTIRGEHLTGRAAIAQGHGGIFATIYADSVNRMELVRAEEIGGGSMLAVSANTLTCPSGPLAGVHRAVSTSVIAPTADGTGFHVVATQNTLVAGAVSER
jgi:uncharacterized protein (TIGR02246 family)